jgi:hypothetical protein
MWLWRVLLRLWAIIPVNSRFGRFNSRLGLGEFPFWCATGICRQVLELPYDFFHQMAVLGAKSKKFPVSRELPGTGCS